MNKEREKVRESELKNHRGKDKETQRTKETNTKNRNFVNSPQASMSVSRLSLRYSSNDYSGLIASTKHQRRTHTHNSRASVGAGYHSPTRGGIKGGSAPQRLAGRG